MNFQKKLYLLWLLLVDLGLGFFAEVGALKVGRLCAAGAQSRETLRSGYIKQTNKKATPQHQ
jgi:hypothetical protein